MLVCEYSVEYLYTRRNDGIAEDPQTLLCDIQINILPTMYRSLTAQTVSDLDVSRSLKVKCDGAVGLPIYAWPHIWFPVNV